MKSLLERCFDLEAVPVDTLRAPRARRVGLADYPQGSVDQLKRQALRGIAGQGADLDFLRAHGAVRSPVAAPLLFGSGRVKTRNGKVQLLDSAPADPEVEPPAARPGASAPLWLFSNSTEKSQASQWVGKRLGARTWVAVHPDAVPGLADGAIVEVDSPLGTVEVELRLDHRHGPTPRSCPRAATSRPGRARTR